ncbi:6-phosphogluconolactonase [Phenylobacterium montanum]|uniref:6-phosphogluconolactonase n=1 Tax=Phenylobacterium montanum TaxID=2823693 RepID=A0A975IVG7_9CAUL|nr:6-phosphogluconolactonase [Caulobacter sp. S6]QUD88755.1 6-phosphogluconolactonase [Caulobacter sp. S6]
MAQEQLFDIREDRTAALAREIAVRLEDAVQARGAASLVATGGSTPGPLYDALAQAPLSWDRVSITLSDERWVPPDDPSSNENLVRRRLLTGHAAGAWFVGLKTPHATPADGAAEVEKALAALPCPFDVVVLGMGGDGHFASLFPGAPELVEGLDANGRDLVIPVRRVGAAGAAERLSLTLSAILNARWIAILIDGADKLEVCRRAAANAVPDELPIRAVLNQSTTPVDIWWAP